MNDNAFPIMVSVVVTSAAQLTSVYALLGGASLAAVASSASAAPKASAAPVADAAAPSSQADQGSAAAGTDTGGTTADVSGDIDTGGHPWSETLHASTKTKTKDGYWRMKVGVSRPADLPGFPKDATGTGSTGTEASAGAAATTGNASGTAAAPAGDEDDEFAAFRTALDKDAAAGASAAVPARKWTDADLGALCNQAAVKLGDPAPVKALIAEYVEAGTVPHSRNIPEAKRADFAAAVEAKAGIEFAG